MIDPKTKLTVKHDDNGVFSDHSQKAADYIRDDFSIDLSSTEDYLYLGLAKPFGATYVAVSTANVNANTLAAEIWDGTAWTAVELTDETEGLTRSGFMFWDKVGMTSSAVDGEDAFYLRLRPSADQSATSVRGVNLVFSDDNQLKSEFFEIDNSSLLPAGENSFITKHASTRNRIIQEFRKLKYRTQVGTAQPQSLDQWDLIDIFEVREAATFLTLSEIFFNLSDSLEDHWWIKYKEYQKKYEEMIRIATLSIDSDDDGIDDDDEVAQPIKVFRWNR